MRVPRETKSSAAKLAPRQQGCCGSHDHQRRQLLPIHAGNITSISSPATNDLARGTTIFLASAEQNPQTPVTQASAPQSPGTEGGTSNIQQPTSNFQWPPVWQSLEVGCSMLVVGCFRVHRKGRGEGERIILQSHKPNHRRSRQTPRTLRQSRRVPFRSNHFLPAPPLTAPARAAPARSGSCPGNSHPRGSAPAAIHP